MRGIALEQQLRAAVAIGIAQKCADIRQPWRARCVAVCIACIFACVFQLHLGVKGDCLFKEDKQSIKPYNREEMEQMLDQMDISIKEYYSSENSDLKLKYDPYDFSLYK